MGNADFHRRGGLAIIADVQVRYPDVQIGQSCGYVEELAANLRNGALDLAILPMHPASALSDMISTPFLPGRNVIACRAGSLTFLSTAQASAAVSRPPGRGHCACG